MEKFENPIEISPFMKLTIEKLKNKLLYFNNMGLVLITDFEIETKVKIVRTTRWFKPDEVKEVQAHYLTAIEITVYNQQLNIWGILNNDAADSIIVIYDLPKGREQYIKKFKEPLEALGLEIKKIKHD